MLNLVIVNVGNSLRTRISIVVLTLIAWVTIVTSVQMVSYDLQSRRGIVGSRSMVIWGQLQKVVEMLKNYPNEKLFLGA